MEVKRFTKNDSSFICAHCGRKVLPLGYSSRNHCPFCLYSLHVDNMPGDRANPCKGLMRPMRADPDSKKGYIITYRCEKCGDVKRNCAAVTGKVQPDDVNKLILLTAGMYKDD
ncbi:MAG: RNHCP domain-containing protein [Eubacteriales bacterium]|nr:RNHCP domain-containing protein [Eubacteriales bacterium]